MKTLSMLRRHSLSLVPLALLAGLCACSSGNDQPSNPTGRMGAQGDIFGDWDTGTPYHSTSSHTWGVDYD